MSFNWDKNENKDDTFWEDGNIPSSEDITSNQQNSTTWLTPRNMLLFILFLALGGLAGWSIWWSEGRIAAREEAIQRDITLLFSELYGAVAAQDVNTFATLLNGRDETWVDQQLQLLETNNFLDRPPFQLTADTRPTPELAEIDIAPDQRSAIIRWPQPYHTPDNQTITLTQTQQVAWSSGRWRLAPFTAEFWGERVALQATPGISIDYSQEHTPWAGQLINTINGAFDKQQLSFCAESSPAFCLTGQAPPYQVVHFSDDPTTLYAIWENEIDYHASLPAKPVQLPSPTLVGLPTDKAGEQFLLDGYVKQYRMALEATALGCCGVLNQALLNRHLAEIGLRPWPHPKSDYAQYFHTPFPLHSILFQQNRTEEPPNPEQQWQAHLVADYIYEQASEDWRVEAQAIQATPTPWIMQVNQATNITLPTQQPPWLQFISQKAGIPLNPADLPVETAELLCKQAPIETTDLEWYTYQTDSNRWETSQIWTQGKDLYNRPQLNGYTLQTLSEQQAAIYQTGQLLTSVDLRTPFTDLMFQEFPLYSNNGRYLAVAAQPNSSNLTRYWQIDRQKCNTLNVRFCSLTTLSGRPLWNADDQHVLLSEGLPIGNELEETEGKPLPTNLVLATARGIPEWELGRGFAPFWLGEQTFGFVHEGETAAATTILTGTVGSEQLNPWFTKEELLAPLPERYRFISIFIRHITPLPNRPDLTLIILSTPVVEGGETLLLFYDQKQQVWLPEIILDSRIDEQKWSPNGRWLALYSASGKNVILDADSLEITGHLPGRPNTINWASDGETLLHTYRGFLSLYQPRTDALRLAPYPIGLDTCLTSQFVIP